MCTQSLLSYNSLNGEAGGKRFDPPWMIEGARGFRFGCEFDNPRDQNVIWGFDDQDMCDVLGFADSGPVFESMAYTAEDAGDDGGTRQFTGVCETLMVDWLAKR